MIIDMILQARVKIGKAENESDLNYDCENKSETKKYIFNLKLKARNLLVCISCKIYDYCSEIFNKFV